MIRVAHIIQDRAPCASDGAAGLTHIEPTREEAVGGTQFHT